MAESSNSKDGYPQELRDVGEVALLLVSIKDDEFDDESIVKLHKLINKDLGGVDKGKGILYQHEESTPKVKLAAAAALSIKEEPIQEDHSAEYLLRYTPPSIPPVASLKGLITDCSKPFEKQLTASDVKDDQNRLTMNKIDVEEKLIPLLREGEDLNKGINVVTYDSDGNQYHMEFKNWGKLHVLIRGWKQFYKDHKLRKHEDFVTLWMFRHAETGKLCFVITSRWLPEFKLLLKRRRQN